MKLLDNSKLAAAVTAAVAAEQKSRGYPSETLQLQRAEIRKQLSPEAVDAILDCSPMELLHIAGVSYDTPEARELRFAAEMLGGRTALCQAFRHADDAVLSPESAKMSEEVRTLALRIECSHKTALYMYCVMDRLARLESRVYNQDAQEEEAT